jgi:hypothetical protein
MITSSVRADEKGMLFRKMESVKIFSETMENSVDGLYPEVMEAQI